MNPNTPTPQDNLLAFLDDPDTIKKAVEGSMEKRAAVLGAPQVDELEKIVITFARDISTKGLKYHGFSMDAMLRSREFTAALHALIDRTVAEREKKAYLRGYNSGWVKANRLTAKPQSIEYLAKQLEAAATTLRAAVQTQE